MSIEEHQVAKLSKRTGRPGRRGEARRGTTKKVPTAQSDGDGKGNGDGDGSAKARHQRAATAGRPRGTDLLTNQECRDRWMIFVIQFIRRGLRLFVKGGLPLTLFLQEVHFIDEGRFKLDHC